MIYAVVCIVLVLVGAATGQPAVQTSYEEGDVNPDGWKLQGEPGKWEHEGHLGAKSVSITGDGKNSNGWVLQPVPLEPNRTYRFSVWYKSEEVERTDSGVLTLGPNFAMRIHRHSPEWTRVAYVFSTPASLSDKSIRNGQWHFRGTAWYDDCRVEPVSLAYLNKDGITLDQNERIENGAYVFDANFSTPFTDCFRVDQGHTVQYHNDKWWFHEGEYEIHRYRVGDYRQLSAELLLSINYEDPARQDNEIIVEAGRNGADWREIGRYDACGEYTAKLPADLFPAEQVFVRIRGKGSMQVRKFRYSAKLDGSPPNLKGTTQAFQGGYVIVDNGPLRLTFDEGGRSLVSIQREGEPVGCLECALAQFEKEGVGYKGTGVGIADASGVKSVEVKTNEPRRCVLHVTVERPESSEAARRFEATYEITVYAGQEWFESRLLSVKNTDDNPYELRGYFHRLQPVTTDPIKPWCFPDEAAWLGKESFLGAASGREDEFTLALRLAGAGAHGDITRAMNVKLSPGMTWSGSEPELLVFASGGEAPRDIVRESRKVRQIISSPETHAQGTILLQEHRQNVVKTQEQ